MHANEDKFIICGNCHKNPPLFNRTISVLRYQSPITQVIARLKFGKKLVYSELLAQLLCEKLSSTYQQIPFPQAIIPIPLHARRLRERGYNQVIEIARSVSKTLKIPVLSTHCIKNRATLAQSTLVAKKRAKNIKNAFSIKKPIDSQYVAILDDVVTTGSTVRELSAVLLRAGVKKIDVWCCARTSLTHF
jgi:ComF family protein